MSPMNLAKNEPKRVAPQGPAPILPNWVLDGTAAMNLENAGFASGSALALLHTVLNNPSIPVPTKLLRNRYALKAALACLKFERRSDDEGQLLDAYYLTAAGDQRGPGGDMLAFWLDACSISFRGKGWENRIIDLLPGHLRDDAYDWLDTELDGSEISSPVALAARRLSQVIEKHPHEEAVAFLIADVVLSRGLGWIHPFPFFAHHLKKRHLLNEEGDLLLNSHLAIATITQEIIRSAHDLARRAEKLNMVAPKLRATGSDQALELFLSELAVSPASMLSPKIKGSSVAMTARSARRLCDRLENLGVVRELTGRSTFRLYGV
jgi:hypothetical protein